MKLIKSDSRKLWDVQLFDCNVSCLFEKCNSSEIREMELMLLLAQDLPVGTSMSMGTNGITIGK